MMEKYIENIEHTSQCIEHFMSHFDYGNISTKEQWKLKDAEIWNQIKVCVQCIEDRSKKCDCPVKKIKWEPAFIRKELKPEYIMPRQEYRSDTLVNESIDSNDTWLRQSFDGFDIHSFDRSRNEIVREMMDCAALYKPQE